MVLVAVDFDGTLCENKYPEIGNPKNKMIDKIREHKKNGDIIILWTTRGGEDLERAIEWCKRMDIPIDFVNDNPPEQQKKWGNNNRKVYADIYYDDKCINVKEIEISEENKLKDKIKEKHNLIHSLMDKFSEAEDEEKRDSYNKIIDEEMQELRKLMLELDRYEAKKKEEKAQQEMCRELNEENKIM